MGSKLCAEGRSASPELRKHAVQIAVHCRFPLLRECQKGVVGNTCDCMDDCTRAHALHVDDFGVAKRGINHEWVEWKLVDMFCGPVVPNAPQAAKTPTTGSSEPSRKARSALATHVQSIRQDDVAEDDQTSCFRRDSPVFKVTKWPLRRHCLPTTPSDTGRHFDVMAACSN